MALTKVCLGDIVLPYVQKCNNPNLTADDISGVNKDKEFFEPSKQAGSDTSNYKVVPPAYFACNLMHVGRDRVLPIALNHTNRNKIVSPAYTVFCLNDQTLLLNEFFLMMLKSNERDRYFWFHTDTSVRDGMAWEDFCEVEVEIPPLIVQKRYIAIYKAIQDDLKVHIQKSAYLQHINKVYLESVKKTPEKKKISELLREVDYRNANGVLKEVQGINISKQFMPSIADTRGIDLTKYKVVPPRHFACNLMHVGRDEIFPIALNRTDVAILVSPAYTVLEVAPNVVPEYLMGWFSCAEFDRMSWFMTDSSIRGGLDINEFYQMNVPIPTYEVQEAVANIQKSFKRTISMTDEMSKISSTICPILVSGALKEGAKS